MLKVKYANNYFDIQESLSITKASNEVDFNDIVVDFTGHTFDELPTKYQEVKIVEIENGTENTIYSGFLEDYKINSRKNEDEDVELTMTLLTPMKMATMRYITIFGSYAVPELINEILQPLIKDGFNLKVNEAPYKSYNAKWNLKSVENAMNILSNVFNLWWYIDEQKNIYIYEIENLLNRNPKLQITKEQIIDGMHEFTTELSTENYANQLSIKNARVVRRAEGCGIGSNAYPLIFFDRLSKFYQDEEYEFDNPIVFYKPEEYSQDQLLFRAYLSHYAIFVTGMLADGTIKGYYYVNPAYDIDSDGNVIITSYDKQVINEGMAVQADGMDEETEEKYIILFKRDSFFKNLITGFKFKGVTSFIATQTMWGRQLPPSPYTDTALVNEIYKVKDKGEIARKKGIISDTGIVEDVIDANEKWFTENQLYQYAISQLDTLKTDATQVTIKVDERSQIDIGDVVEIDWQDFFVKNKFICTNITQNIQKTEPEIIMDWEIKLVNAEMNSTFIDLFRTNDTEEDEDRTIYHVEGIYDSEEVNEKVEIKKDEVIG